VINKRPVPKTRREKKRSKKKIIILITALVVIIGSFVYTMNQDSLAIREVRIEGQRTLIASDVRDIIDDYLGRTLLGILPRDNVILLSTDRLTQYLKETLPKIEHIEMSIENGNKLVVHIGERSAHSLWCIDRDYESVFDEECYFADQDGLLYARAPYFSGGVYMKFFLPPNDTQNEYIGHTVTAVNSFTDFFDFLNTLEEMYSLAVHGVSFNEFGDVTIALSRVRTRVYPQTMPYIIYNQSDDYETVLRNVGIVLNFDDFNRDFTNRPSSLESIDVRFDGRVFYTFTPIGGRPEPVPQTDNDIPEPIEETIQDNINTG